MQTCELQVEQQSLSWVKSVCVCGGGGGGGDYWWTIYLWAALCKPYSLMCIKAMCLYVAMHLSQISFAITSYSVEKYFIRNVMDTFFKTALYKNTRHCLLSCWFRRRSKKTSKLRVTGFCAGNSPVTGEFPGQKASNAENVSISWRHHELDVAQVFEARISNKNVNMSLNVGCFVYIIIFVKIIRQLTHWAIKM